MTNKNATLTFKISSEETIGFTFDQTFKLLEKRFPKLVLSRQAKLDLRTAFFEAVANTIRHASELKQYKYVRGRLFINHKQIGFEVEDHGVGFDINSVAEPDWFDLKSSGRGVFMMKQLG